MVFKESIIPMLMKIIVFCQGCLIAESGANCGAGGGGGYAPVSLPPWLECLLGAEKLRADQWTFRTYSLPTF